MAIEVKCKAADYLPIDRIMEFQGGLKTLSKANREKLERSIKKHGFIAPLFLWDDSGEWRLLDGHQRLATLLNLREQGEDIPLLPVDYIEAENEQDAKEKLLQVTSQYGDFSTEGILEFAEGIGFDFQEVSLSDSGRLVFEDMADIDDLFADSPEKTDEEEKERCPHCGQEMP